MALSTRPESNSVSVTEQERVRSVLQAVADGRGTVKDVAKDMGLSYRSTKNILKREYDRLGADSLSHLMAIYFRNHLVK